MKIDVFAHILPKRFLKTLRSKAGPGFYVSDVIDGCPAISDTDMRFRAMDAYEGYTEVLSILQPPLEIIVGPEDAVELARIANDEMAELVTKYPDRFVSAAACLPMNDLEAAWKELDRAITDLHFGGVQIYSSINGKPLDSPEFLPLYEKMTHYDLPIWIHPVRENKVPDYPGEGSSKYAISSLFGWPYETTVAMTRLVYSGILERYPDLKIITHHCGAMVPYFAGRIESWQDISKVRLGGKDEANLTRRPLDYYRMFYNDTATYGNTSALMCCYAFCGAEHMLFGTDAPIDDENGYRVLRDSIRSVEEMDIPDSDKQKIFEDNAKKLLRLPT